jgi:hypothetical protein
VHRQGDLDLEAERVWPAPAVRTRANERGDRRAAREDHLAVAALLERERLGVDGDGPRAATAREAPGERPVGDPRRVRGVGLVGEAAEPHRVAGDPADHSVAVDQVELERRRR